MPFTGNSDFSLRAINHDGMYSQQWGQDMRMHIEGVSVGGVHALARSS